MELVRMVGEHRVRCQVDVGRDRLILFPSTHYCLKIPTL